MANVLVEEQMWPSRMKVWWENPKTVFCCVLPKTVQVSTPAAETDLLGN